MAGNASRTTTGKKRKQMVTGATSGSQETGSSKRKSQLEAMKANYRGTGFVAPKSTVGVERETGTVKSPTIVRTGSTGRETAGTVYPASTGDTDTGRWGGGGGGGGAGAAEVGVSGANDINQALTGKVGGYGIRPDAIPMLYQEPQALLRMTMNDMGMDPNQNQGLYNMALPNADLVNALAMIGLGGQKGYDAGENSQVLNFMDNLFRQGMTRGGQAIDFSAGMDNIMGASAGSPLDTMMNMDDPRGQYAAVSSLMLPLAEAGLHPLFARSLQKSLEGLRDEYYQTYANGAKPPANFQGFAGGRLGM